MKENDTIYLLPRFEDTNRDMAAHFKHFQNNWEIAPTLDYRPNSMEELKRIDYSDFKVVMSQNENFFNATVALCGDIIEDVIDLCKKVEDEAEHEAVLLDHVETLDDLLNSGYLGVDYQSSRREFVSLFFDFFYD